MTLRLARSASAVLIAITLALSFFTLTGCETELSHENDRIRMKADHEAPADAVRKVQQKYGFEADVVGVDSQGSSSLFSYEVSPYTYVIMHHEDRFFTVLVNVDNADVFFDNYQAPEIASALDDYFAQVQNLPTPYASDTTFICNEYPRDAYQNDTATVKQNTPANASEGNGKSSYDVRNLVNFTYTGQSSQELLQCFREVSFENSYVGTEVEIEGQTFDPDSGAWPSTKGFNASMILSTYHDEADYQRASYESFRTTWWMRDASLYATMRYPTNDSASAIADNSYAYVKRSTTDIGGCTIIGRSVFNTTEAVSVDDSIPSWKVDEVAGLADTKVPEAFSQVTPLYNVSPAAEDTSIAAAKEQDPELYFKGSFYLAVPQSCRAQDGSFFVGLYYPDSDDVEVRYCNTEAYPADEPQIVALFAVDSRRERRAYYAILQPANA